MLTHTKILFTKKESRSDEFLSELRITITTLPLSSMFQHLHFLQDERENVNRAESITEVFDILDRHWNWSDYYLLQRLVAEFGDESLKQEITKYVAELEQFEKATTIQLFNSPILFMQIRNWKHPYAFSRAVMMLQKDASECTLYDIRKLKEELTSKSSLNKGTIYNGDVRTSSVAVEVAFPEDALELIAPALDAAFLKQHHIISVTLDGKPLEEYDEDYIKVSYCVLNILHGVMQCSRQDFPQSGGLSLPVNFVN